MPSYFDKINASFVDVPVGADKGVSTPEFLDAAHELTGLFDLLGSVAFGTVQSDLRNNIKKIRTRYEAAKAESGTLQDLVRAELKSKAHTATEGLLWLTRGLDFTAQSLRQSVNNPATELAPSFRKGYDGTLKPHHNFVVKGIVSAALSAVPYRKDFFAKLGGEEEIKDQLEAWLSALEAQVEILKEFVNSKEAKW